MSGIQIQSEICHIDPDRTIVRATASKDGTELGTALGEGKSAETAEDRAIQRLITRLRNNKKKVQQNSQETNNASNKNVDSKIANNIQPKIRPETKEEVRFNSQPNNNKKDIELTKKPTNWSDELAQIDHHLTRLGWNKEKESEYLAKEFNVKSRSRITDYDLLDSYLKKLKEINTSIDDLSNKGNVMRDDLIKQSDLLITEIGLSKIEARELLVKKMNTNSRLNLKDDELRKFNSYLKELSTTNE